MNDYLDDFICGPTSEEYYNDNIDEYWDDYDYYPNFNIIGWNE